MLQIVVKNTKPNNLHFTGGAAKGLDGEAVEAGRRGFLLMKKTLLLEGHAGLMVVQVDSLCYPLLFFEF